MRQRACHKGQPPNRAKQVEEGHTSKRRMEVGALLDAHVRLLAHNAGNVLIQVEEQHDGDCRHCTCQNAFWRNVGQVCGPRPNFSGGKSWQDKVTNGFFSSPRALAGLASKMVCSTDSHAWATAKTTMPILRFTGNKVHRKKFASRIAATMAKIKIEIVNALASKLTRHALEHDNHSASTHEENKATKNTNWTKSSQAMLHNLPAAV